MRALLPVTAILAFAACGPRVKDPGEDLMSIEVEPANATIVSDGGPASLAYTAIGTYADGHKAPLTNVTFGLDLDGQTLGTFADADFTAYGTIAGKGGVVAQFDELTASTAVYVEVHPVRLGPGVPADGADKFPPTSPPGALSPTIVYPLDGVVMPSSVKAPDVQWEGPLGATDLYRVRMTSGLATLDTILAGSPTFKLDSQPSPADWQLLVNSAGNGLITVTVDHWDEVNGAHGGTPVQIKMIQADITGVLYYWNLDAGRMERIDAMGRADAIPFPPPRPGDNKRCIACHSVSKDGRYLSAAVWDGGQQGAVFDMSNPLVRTADPAPTVAPLSTTTYLNLFSTFNPDATRLMVNQGTALTLIDPATGATVPTNGTPLPAANAAHPAWSPDGTTVAFINNILNGGVAASWGVDYTSGDLAILPASAGDTFGAPTNLVASASAGAGFAAPSWPSFSPDSSWIAYGAGTNSRGRNGTTTFPGSLFLINKAGGITQRLDTACGGARACYLPNFSPYDAGGYYWLVFYSFRDYGNALAGTKGTGRRQLWITAIDKSKLTAGVDPSVVPYWVPDQDTATQNMSAFWAVPAPLQ